MGVLPKKLEFGAFNCRRLAAFALVLGLFCLWFRPAVAAPPNQPTLNLRRFGTNIFLTASNCPDTNIQYVTQISADLLNWSSITTNLGSPLGFINVFSSTNFCAFFRLIPNPPPGPIFRAAMVTISNMNFHGNGSIIDSFDSSDTNYSTSGQYDPTKRRANAIAGTTCSITNAIVLGNSDIYGSVVTGPGTTQTVVTIGANGAVGDATWIGSLNRGIESNHWTGNFNTRFPDVPPPPWTGMAFPPPDTNGNINLTASNACFTTVFLPTNRMVIGAPTFIWAQQSTLGTNVFTIPAGSIIITNGGSLALYLGTSASGGNALYILGNLNSPGYASDLQIFGLPSLTAISISGNGALVGCLYAPRANLSVTSGGAASTDYTGAIVANSLIASGHFNVHFDENLLVNGPSR